MTALNRRTQDDRLAALPERAVLSLLGPGDGATGRIIAESLRLDKLTRGLDPETAALTITFDKWHRKRRQLARERRA